MSQSEKPPSFQFYPKDWFSDINVRRMSAEGRGIYWDLIGHCFLEGYVDSDPKEIARIVGEPVRVVNKHYDDLRRCFRAGKKKGRWINPRVNADKRAQNRRKKEQSDAGRAGAKKRWRDKGLDGHPNELPMANDSSPPPSPSPVGIRTHHPRPMESEGGNGNASGGGEDFIQAWGEVVDAWLPPGRSDRHLLPDFRRWAKTDMKNRSPEALRKGWETYRRNHT